MSFGSWAIQEKPRQLTWFEVNAVLLRNFGAPLITPEQFTQACTIAFARVTRRPR